ncbi:MAG: lipid-binding SYLF domain-containing protein [Synergistaceae bacterium]|nr:lipid-binding SYLF domain-containing protein [Synergistaceae bacterium]
MKKVLAVLALVLALVPACAFAATTPDKIIADSIGVIKEMTAKKDAPDVAAMLKEAKAVAIVPALVKAGFMFGGEYGEGLILRRENGKWYGPGFYNISGGSFGLQIGAQSIALVLVITNEDGVKAFLKSKSKLGGDVAVAAGPVGRRMEGATDGKGRADIYSYSISRGLFAGMSLEGSIVAISVKRNEQYWNKSIKAVDALKIQATDKRMKELTQSLDNLIKKAKN